MTRSSNTIANIANKRGIVIVLNITIALLLICTMFLSFHIFVEAEILSKWYAFIGGGLLCYLISLLATQNRQINIDQITILIIIFIGYLLIRALLNPLELNNTFILSLIAFILLYLSFKLFPTDCILNIELIILSACVAQACFGLMQYIGIFHTYKVFKIVGSFDNPAGFSACLSAGFPFCLSVIKKGRWERYFGMASLIVIAASIILSGSRAGILAITTVMALYFGNKYICVVKRYRKYTFPAIVILLIAMCGLFFQKKDSALGRVLIWKSSCDMVIDNPIFGNNTGGFMSNYMYYQADYFEKNPDSTYSMLADNVTHPFNEYLLLTIEYGLIGLLLLISVLFVILKSSKSTSISILCLLSISVFACFSYPLRYPFVIVLIAYSLTLIKAKVFIIIPINVFSKIAGAILIGTICIFLVYEIRFERHWGKLVQKTKLGNHEKLLSRYDELYTQWNGDPLFLYNYGAILSECKNYKKSNAVLIECTNYLNDYDVQMIIAENYSKLEQWNEAKTYYNTAHNMIPNRFLPLYKLMILYEKIEDKPHSLEMATIIINKEKKVSSGTVTYIKSEAQRVIDNFE